MDAGVVHAAPSRYMSRPQSDKLLLDWKQSASEQEHATFLRKLKKTIAFNESNPNYFNNVVVSFIPSLKGRVIRLNSKTGCEVFGNIIGPPLSPDRYSGDNYNTAGKVHNFGKSSIAEVNFSFNGEIYMKPPASHNDDPVYTVLYAQQQKFREWLQAVQAAWDELAPSAASLVVDDKDKKTPGALIKLPAAASRYPHATVKFRSVMVKKHPYTASYALSPPDVFKACLEYRSEPYVHGLEEPSADESDASIHHAFNCAFNGMEEIDRLNKAAFKAYNGKTKLETYPCMLVPSMIPWNDQDTRLRMPAPLVHAVHRNPLHFFMCEFRVAIISDKNLALYADAYHHVGRRADGMPGSISSHGSGPITVFPPADELDDPAVLGDSPASN